MRLHALREELRRELSTPKTQRIFNYWKQGDFELRHYPTVLSVLTALEDQARVGFEAQERLLRALIAQAQAHPEQRLWRQILLHAFLPGLMRMRRRTIVGEHDAHDVDAALWTAFFEVLHGYPLRRPGGVAKGLLCDTGKTYLGALKMTQEAREHQRALVAYARGLSGAGAEAFDLAELQEPHPLTIEPEDHAELRVALARCEGLSAEDIDLLMATDIDGRTIPEYMQMHQLATGDEEVDQREQKRLWQRRLRARDRLRHFFEKK